MKQKGLRSWVFLALAAIGLNAHAADAVLSWTAPTQNTDGTSLTDLAGFKVYRGTSATALSFLADDSASPFTDAGLAPGTYWYTVTAVNALGAESAKPPAISTTIIAPPPVPKVPNPPNSLSVTSAVDPVPPVGGLRSNPGFYVGSGAVFSYLTGDNLVWKIEEVQREIDRHMALPQVKGFHFRIAWDHLEHVRGVYNFTTIDAMVAYIHAKYPGKMWSAEIWDVKFATNPTNFVPAWLANEPDSAGGWTVDPNIGATKANAYKASVMDRKIALWQAFTNHYKDDATLAKLHTEESSFNFTSGAGFSVAADRAQMIRYYAALAVMQDSVIKAPICAEANFWNSIQHTEQLVADIYASGLACLGGPDTFGASRMDQATWSQLVGIGKHWNGTAWVDAGGKDYRPLLIMGYQVEEPEMVGYAGSVPGSPYAFPDIYAMSHNVLRNNYTTVCLTPTTYGTVNTPAYKASDDAFAYIVANNLTTWPVTIQ